MLNALVRCGELQRVPQLLEDMRDASPPIEPDMITYSTIMKGYCSSGDLNKGLELLQDMEVSGQFAPDEVMYNSLLEGCAKTAP
jgi:pentatricopeptide repeat protein